MNKFLLFSLSLLLILPGAGFSERVTININASVLERSCTIVNESLNLTIDLQGGDLRQSRPGIPFAGTPFSIKLTDCPDNISSANITFTGESDIAMGNLLKNLNETENAAQGVALGLYDSESKNIDIRNNKEILNIDHDLATQIFYFFAYYVKTNDTPVAGKVMSIVDFELAYD
ncbi:fimbrial protein [Klebsiella sp. BIGb0407]|uniref:fimbrial protein n=1 Tax=Klebsiella sp. BIGb0407 TaxID=2940603 RepID=UPI00216A25C3|nr:fimbrial protein [Klebsiella sp. BIGb0407]MCS3433420.1 type 1 fimbria pilin [Klebsiella sp. BIGb0407]